MKANKNKPILKTIFFSGTAGIAALAFTMSGNLSQIKTVAEETIEIVKKVTYISAGVIPNTEPIPNSDDEQENPIIILPSESNDEPFTIESRDSTEPNNTTHEEQTKEITTESSDEPTELCIRRNILDFDDGLDYSADGNLSGYITRYTYLPTQDPTFFDLESGAQVRNCTWLSNESLLEESALLPEFKIELNGEPQVLIMHTHTTESYEPYSRNYYDTEFPYRTQDSTHNVVAVGDKIAEQLSAAGIGVIHDGTVHDYPSYNGAYQRSEETVKEYLEKYPSIKIVLDVHRDALESQDGVRIAPVAEIDGKSSAQVMIISGCDDGTFNMPNYLKNFRLACLFQNSLADYENLSRAVLFDYRKYNQHLTTGSLLLEIGGHANSLEEALYCGELVGKSISKALLTLS